MIGKLFPRILNKSSDKSAIKPNEFIDAINVLVSSDDGGDGNVIKKIDGTISAVIEDPENFPFSFDGSSGSNVSEVVIGHLVDEAKKRVYYFACSNESQTSSVYLAKESDDGSGIVFMCLLRDSDLEFSEEDFVASNVIRVPKKNIDSGLDSNVSGEMGDENPGFDDFGFGEDSSNLYVLEQPEVSVEFDITGAEWVDPNSVGGGNHLFYMTLANSGVASATANIYASLAGTLPSGVNVSVYPISGQTVVQPFSQQTVTIKVEFDIVNPPINVSGPIVFPVEVGIEQVDDGNLNGPALVETYPVSVTFNPPSKVYPDRAVLSYGTYDSTAGVLDLPSVTMLSNQPIPESDLYSIQGPFTITFEGGVPGTYEYRPRIRIYLNSTLSANQSPPFRYYFGGFLSNSADITLENPGFNNSGEVFIESTDDITSSSFTYWLVKSYDTNDWIDDVANGDPSNPSLFTFDYFLSFRETFVDAAGLTQSTPLNFNSSNPPVVNIQHVAGVQDIPSPAQISVQDLTASVLATGEINLPAHVEQGYNTNNGGQFSLSFRVVNSGETDGFFQNLITPSSGLYQLITSQWQNTGAASPADSAEAIDNTSGGGILKGFSQLCSFSVSDSIGNVLFSNMFPRSESILDYPLQGGGTLRGATDGTYLSFLDVSGGSTTGAAVNIFEVPAEDFVTVEYIFSNSDPDFQYGYSSSYQVSEEITNPTDYPSGVYNFYGGGPNNNPIPITLEVRTGLSNDLTSMSNTVINESISLQVDTPPSGEMKIFSNSPQASSSIWTDPNFSPLLSDFGDYDPVTNPNPMVAAYGQNEGEPFILAGRYSFMNSVQSTNNVLSTIQSSNPTNGYLGFLNQSVIAIPEEPVDFIFYNNSEDGSPATVVLESDTNISWINLLEEVGIPASQQLGSSELIQILGNIPPTPTTLSGRVDLFKATNEVHGGFFQSGAFVVPSPASTGSLGTAWAASPATPISEEEVTQNGFPTIPDSDFFAAGSIRSSWDPDPTLGAYNYDPTAVAQFVGSWFYGGWRTITFDVPPGHFRKLRLYANFSDSSNFADPGVDDFMNNTSFGDLPDYTNRNNVWGAPVAIRASWTGGIGNPEPNLVGIGGALLVTTPTQFSSITQ